MTSTTTTATSPRAASTTAASATTAVRSYIEGSLAPVREERTAFDLPITGTLPAELCGRYVRNGPNPIDADPATYHWFTGEGMVHGVRLSAGRAEWYRNRFVRTKNVTDALGEPEIPASRQAEGVSGSVNTNVVQIANRTFALVEAGSHPVELTDELESIATVDFGGTLHEAFTAHPRLDPRSGLWHAITYYWPEEALRYVVVGPDARVQREEIIELGERSMVHDTAITESSVLILDLPVTFDLEDAMTGQHFPYHWNPEREARIGVMPLNGTADEIQWCSVPQCYVFHTFNAFDAADGKIILDVVRWPRMFDRDRLGPNEGTPRVERWVLDPGAGTSSVDTVADVAVELPRIDERLIGAPHRFGYAGLGGEPGAAHAPLHRIDFATGGVTTLDFGPSGAAHEFVFVPRDGSTSEEDGWLMGFVTDRSTDATDLVVVAADDLLAGPVARVHLPARVPDGFHGNWLPDAG